MPNFTIHRGEKLEKLLREAGPRKARAITPELDEFLSLESAELALFLSGFQGSGKTSIILEAMSRLPADQCMYITIDSEDKTRCLSDFLFEHMFDKDFQYIFIDDADRLTDFGRNSKIIGHNVATFKRMVVAGDPTALRIAQIDPFLDCCWSHNVNRLNFREWSALTGSTDLADWLKTGAFPSFGSLDVRHLIGGIAKTMEKACASCRTTFWNGVDWLIQEKKLEDTLAAVIDAMVLRLAGNAAHEIGIQLPKAFRDFAADLDERIVRLEISEMVAATCLLALEDIGLVTRSRVAMPWDVRLPRIASRDFGQPFYEPYQGNGEQLDVFASNKLGISLFRIPGMALASCVGMSERAGARLPDGIGEMILKQAARKAVIIEVTGLVPYPGRLNSRFWIWGAGGRFVVYDEQTSEKVLKIAFDPCDGLRPFEVGVAERKNKKIMPTGDFLLELPKIMARAIGHYRCRH